MNVPLSHSGRGPSPQAGVRGVCCILFPLIRHSHKGSWHLLPEQEKGAHLWYYSFMPSEDTNNITGMKPHVLSAALCYMGILVLIPIVSGATSNPFVQFHVRRGLILLAGEAIAIITALFFPYVGGLLFLVTLITSIAGLFLLLQGDTPHA